VQINDYADSQFHVVPDLDYELKEVVMGLHWDPPEEGAGADPADLDALCVLFDAQRSVLEVIHPAHPGTADGAVIHTGDSRTGASEWDDERIFVFLKALPESVSALSFAVASPAGRSFGKVRGASCHVSDRVTERELLRVEFTAADRHTTHCVATLHRGAAGWSISADAHPLQGERLEALLSRVRNGKNSSSRPPAGGVA